MCLRANYESHLRAEGENHRERMRRIADQARKRSGMAPGTRDTRVSAILCSIVKSNGNLSYWGPYNRIDTSRSIRRTWSCAN